MIGRDKYDSWRALTAAALVMAAALPAQASTPSMLDGDITEAEFEQSFERFEALPAAPSPGHGVVDLESFDPPLEPELDEHDTVRSLGVGVASYYGKRFHGRPTASGERFNMRAMTAAHKTLPFGTKVRVINPRNGREVVVRINDRGPYSGGRAIDLSRAAAEEIGLINAGHGRVELEVVS
ncbi:MAG: septal ring lytic transglycosylase RlpA family protein [Erythrobacter sp.]|jgi:rare lipoprotein A|nr:septal ring lytic transglycosylase RlpA family protein [Erythrobacter sp.]RZV34444.1 MAG: septal ring lytic transglycosylase RlpA family protein [Sphingomonadaceae bacterium]